MFNSLRVTVLGVVGAGWTAACSVEATSSADAYAGEHGACPHTSHEFSYEESETTGPVHWEDILGPDGKPKYEACGGSVGGAPVQQSPIEIADGILSESPGAFGLSLGADLRWSRTATVTSLWNNGHTWQAGFADPSLALVADGGVSFGLKQFHFHAPAEHTMFGKEYPLEMHFVHLSPTGKAFEAAPFAAVVGVMFEEDPSGQDNPELAKIWDRFSACAQEKDEATSGITLDLLALLPSDMTYVRYDGSLTTPPCSVTVRFHLLTQPLRASAKQIAALTDAVGRNDRPHQPLLETTDVTMHASAQP